MATYCSYVSKIKDPEDVDKRYHDYQYGVRIEDDNELFGRLLMEINQAGLSWRTILLKEKGLRKAYDNFDVRRIANYKEEDVHQLLQDASIIRNRLKIEAAIYNAQVVLRIQKEYGSFLGWIDINEEELEQDVEAWVRLFRKHFKFVGGEIVKEFLKSINTLPGSHDRDCGDFRDVLK